MKTLNFPGAPALEFHLSSTSRKLGAVVLSLALFGSACGSDTTSSSDGAQTSTQSEQSAHSGDDQYDDMTGEAGLDGHNGDAAHAHGGGHEVEAGDPVPAVSISLAETGTPGDFDMTVSVENFTITPENIDGDAIANEGHMHLLIDGVKVERFSDLVRTITVPNGDHEVSVELNANDHGAWLVDGEPIRANQTVSVTGGSDVTPADHVITIAVNDDSVDVDGGDEVEVALGSTIQMVITSTVVDHVHVHGYDYLVIVGPDAPAEITLVADIAGVFEVELEDSGRFVAELAVS